MQGRGDSKMVTRGRKQKSCFPKRARELAGPSLALRSGITSLLKTVSISEENNLRCGVGLKCMASTAETMSSAVETAWPLSSGTGGHWKVSRVQGGS
jgi:hypothetical protein